MSGRLADIETRIDTVHKLETVISAMRGIAASRVQEAHLHLESIRTYAATIGMAIGEALAFVPQGDAPDRPPVVPTRHIIVVLAAEQGFAGAFSDQVFDVAAGALSATSEILLVGDRGLTGAEERNLTVGWFAPMIAHPDQTTTLATRIADAIFARIAGTSAARVSIVHASPGGGETLSIATRHLVPFDYARFPLSQSTLPPRMTLPPAVLLARLVEEHIFAEVSEAIMLSFAAENEARMRAMIAAQDNTASSLDDMTKMSRRLRQQDITEEVVELATASLMQR